MRRYGSPPIQGQKYTNRPGAYAIILGKRGLLLTYQDEPYFEFQLPGGGIDPGETPLPALHREIMEETGWHVSIQHHVQTYQRYTYMPEYKIYARKICKIYLAQAIREVSEPIEKDHTACWVDPKKAVTMLASIGDAAVLDSFLNP